MDKQMVMERTGHRSLEWVRSYKRTPSHQQQFYPIYWYIPEKPTTSSYRSFLTTNIVLHLRTHSNSLEQQQQPTLCPASASTNISNISNTKNSLPGHFFCIYIALYQSLFAGVKKRAWYPLFAHVQDFLGIPRNSNCFRILTLFGGGAPLL